MNSGGLFRFQEALRLVKTTGAPLTERQLKAFAASRPVSDITDVLAWMERLSAEKVDLPDWDGDTSDDISKAQLELARLLVLLVRKFELDPESAFLGAGEETRRWLHIACEKLERAEPFWEKWLRRLIRRRS